MSSGRKESVSRHIWNPRIHGGSAQVIPYAEYIAGVQVGTYRPTDAVYRKKDRSIENSSEIPTNANTFTKLFNKVEQKYLDRIAESIVNPKPLSYTHIRTNPLMPRMQKSFFTSEDVFGIEGYICRSCLTIRPAVLTYSSNSKRQSESMNAIYLDSCVTCSAQMSTEERSYYINYNLVNGIAPLLFGWIREYSSDFDRLKLVARRISSLKTESPGYHPNKVNFRTINSSPGKIAHLTITSQRNQPPFIQRKVSLKLEELRVIEVKTMFSENSDRSIPLSHFDSNPIIRAIRETEHPIASASDVYSFLYYTKFSTFGLFRLNLKNTPYGNAVDGRTNDIYFMTLIPKEFSLDIEYSSEMADHEVRIDGSASTARLS